MQLMYGDCMELLPTIPESSIDMVLCDLPYGSTRNQWDTPLSLPELWTQYKRVTKPNAAIVLFAQPPFSAELIVSNRKLFRYEWVWDKGTITGFLNANRMPLKRHETLLVFYEKLPTYNPQKAQGEPVFRGARSVSSNYGQYELQDDKHYDGMRYPTDIIHFAAVREKGQHPTAKPVALLEYLIRTYTQPGDTVLDNCMGSGSTGVACVNTDRDFIGMELSHEYYDMAVERIAKPVPFPDNNL